MADDDLADFEQDAFSHDGKARTVFRKGEGPAVIVIAEMPGITPKVAEFARRVASIGCTAVMPHLFGHPGRDVYALSPPALGWQMASSMVPACISKEFTVLATGRTSPVVAWLRALAAREHERCGGPGVGAIGMCFTGGFALAMAADDRLLAPVLSQPSLPLVVPGRSGNADTIDISPDDLAKVKDRCATGGLQVLGLRFTTDRLVPAGRFEFLREQLGDAFVAIELPGDAANPDATASPHSVVTEHLIDEPGQPTRDALDRVLDLFRTKLVDPF
ncbi:MAG: dienelactone hydrolase family protein [Actinomycetota bacterium]|nr:dienelactone hydrolase family protein [Actinomycetota bacterium]